MQTALRTFDNPPRVWLRYVDDTFVIIDKTQIDPFFAHINSLDDNIKFTQEPMKDNKIPFLDCNVLVANGKLTTAVYRKPTHTDQYLNFDSHHPLIHKLGVIRTLFHRAETVVQGEPEIAQEKNHIKNALGTCGYPNWVYHKANNNQKNKKAITRATTGNKTRVTVPYVAGLSDQIKASYRQFGIQTSFKPYNTLRQQLVSLKDRKPKGRQSNLVYGIVCGAEGCDESYVGETKQALKARLYQHHRPSTSGDPTFDSAVYTHISQTGHIISDKDVKILSKEENWYKRGVKEAVFERLENPSLNRRGGLRHNLSHTWDRALRATPRCLQSTTPRV